MGQMERSLFRPGAGSVIGRFTAAWAEGTIYPNDWVSLSGTATSGQGPGADGVLEGATLGTNDMVYVELADSDLDGNPGLELGVCMGSGLGAVANIALVTGDSVTADNLMIIQQYGVHPMVRTDDAADPTAEYLSISATAGEAAGSATIGASDKGDIGIALLADGAYTRATAADESGGCALIRCGG